MNIKRFLAATILVFSAVSLNAADLQVFAAASLTDALKEIAPAYEKSTGDKLNFNFAGSNVLARQIQEGAPADVFISADEAKMDSLDKAGELQPGSRGSLLSNSLVVVVGRDSAITLASAQDLAGPSIKRLALADTKGVPAGVYANEYLEKLHLWDAVKDRVIPTENVRAALAAVESGNVDAGIVYKTDAAISKAVKVAYEVPAAEGPVISYPLAIIRDSKNPVAAKALAEYLKSAPALAIFKKYGFIVRP